MRRSTFIILWVSAILTFAAVAPAHSLADGITISNQGLYRLVPANQQTRADFMSLKDYALLEKTTDIEAVKGTSFGFEIAVEGDKEVRTMMKIIRPGLQSSAGSPATVQTIPVVLQPDRKYFAGWNFSSDNELQEGSWIFEFELQGSPACVFSIKNVEELVYDGSKLKKMQKSENSSSALKSSMLPYGSMLTRYLVRGGTFTSLDKAKEHARSIEKNGYSPFIFVREIENRRYRYYLFIKMFDSEQKAKEFAEVYRKKFQLMTVPQKIQIRLAPMR